MLAGMTQPFAQAWFDQYASLIADKIRQHGWFIQFVSSVDDDPPPTFAYTIGLFGLGHPELVVTGVDMATAGGLLNELGGRIRAGANFLPGELVTFDDWQHRVVMEEVPNPGEILLMANDHYQRPPEASVSAYQVTYDDTSGRFPWDDGYANSPELQPRPGTWRA